ncbi:hypothetical protein EU537_00145 [Candidatus Thorarchaeota archaeon]|nr:MAG: hypothetical protein EU537_00145 [Candidatus Thorarchaeota archaeon]
MKSRQKFLLLTFVMVPALLFSSTASATNGAVTLGPQKHVNAVIFFSDDIEVNLPDAEIFHQYDNLNGIAARIPESLYKTLENSWFVESIALDGEMSLYQDTLDWGVDDVEAERVWGGFEDAKDVVPGNVAGAGVKVAILDTGIDYTHPDLDDVYAGGYDYVDNDADPLDGNGHGTHCAGIVAAEDNGEGVIGVAPKTSIYSVRVLDDQGSGYTSDIIAGIDWAVDNGMNVVSMSLGGGGYDSSFDAAINRAYDAGLVVVAASGNDGEGTISYPAAYDNAIAVGAIDSNHDLASFSNYGSEQEVVAPGVDIYSTMPTYSVTLTSWWYGYNQNYDQMSGTSMACPMVAGVVSLILDANPDLTPSEVRDILHTTSVDYGANGWDQYFGWGAVDAEAAVDQAGGGGTPSDDPPSCLVADPAEGAIVSGAHRVLVSASDDNSVSKVEVRIDTGTWIDITTNFDGTYYYYDWDTTQYADGSHDVSARATDSVGQTTTDTNSVSVNNDGGSADTLYVASIDMWYEEFRFWFWRWYDVYTEVTVHDGTGSPLSGVTVSIDMTLPSGSHATGSADTGSDGTVTFVYESGDQGTYTSTVTNLEKTGYTYDSSSNVESSESLSVP